MTVSDVSEKVAVSILWKFDTVIPYAGLERPRQERTKTSVSCDFTHSTSDNSL